MKQTIYNKIHSIVEFIIVRLSELSILYYIIIISKFIQL